MGSRKYGVANIKKELRGKKRSRDIDVGANLRTGRVG